MAMALRLGELGRRSAPPNPWVGCVLERDGRVVGSGFHAAPGTPHAEPLALAEAGEEARDATAWVTLEPCDHHGRTAPCTEALIAAGVRRVVVALTDPDPRVSGRGIERLRAAGVEVDVGRGAPAARESLRPYLHHRATGRPWCVLKAAVTLDGRTAAADGTSQWITGPEARADTHRLRADSQAVVIGAGTALADRPRLDVRLAGPEDLPPRPPVRVLLDATGRVPATGPLFDPGLAPTLVLTTPSAAPESVKAWLDAGAEVAEVESAAEMSGTPRAPGMSGTPRAPGMSGTPRAPGGIGVDLASALALLGERGVLQALVEGGPTLHGALVRAGLVDRMVLYVGARLLGAAGMPLLAGPGPATLAEAPEWTILASHLLGRDVRLDCEPAGSGEG